MKNWKIEFDQDLQKLAKKLGKQVMQRIISFLEERIIVQKRHPKSFGEPLIGNLAGLWRYRIGDYRLICKVEEEVLIVLVLEIDHRKQVYKKKN